MGREKQKSEVKAPAYLDKAAQQLIQRATQTSRIGYVPYYGPDVAAMTPMQMASMQGTNQMAGAFGMPTANLSQGMPQAQNYGGLMGYSSGGMYDQAMQEWKRRNPGQYQEVQQLFANPGKGKAK
jgi:hypothetical protein